MLSRVNGSHAAGIEIATIKDAVRHEGESVWQLFAPGMRVALVIGVALAVLQQITGINVFLYFAPEIFRRIVGANTDAAMLQTIVVGVVNMSFTFVAIWTVDSLGRKPLMIFGYVGMGISLLALGLAAHYQRTETWVLLFMLAYIASFALSVGPVTWVILSEIFPTKIRGRAMAIATVCLWIANFIISQTFPMMDDNAWLVRSFIMRFPSTCTVVSVCWRSYSCWPLCPRPKAAHSRKSNAAGAAKRLTSGHWRSQWHRADTHWRSQWHRADTGEASGTEHRAAR